MLTFVATHFILVCEDRSQHSYSHTSDQAVLQKPCVPAVAFLSSQEGLSWLSCTNAARKEESNKKQAYSLVFSTVTDHADDFSCRNTLDPQFHLSKERQ